jgi:hypothetical protein
MIFDLTRHGQPVYSLSSNPEGVLRLCEGHSQLSRRESLSRGFAWWTCHSLVARRWSTGTTRPSPFLPLSPLVTVNRSMSSAGRAIPLMCLGAVMGPCSAPASPLAPLTFSFLTVKRPPPLPLSLLLRLPSKNFLLLLSLWPLLPLILQRRSEPTFLSSRDRYLLPSLPLSSH